MTRNQIKMRLQKLNGDYQKLTSAEKYEYNELTFRRYINYCLEHKQEYLIVKNGVVSMDNDIKNLYCRDKNFNINDEEILKLFNEQKKSFEIA